MTDTLEVMYQVFKSPHQLVCAETTLFFSTSMMPSEEKSDDEPPGWALRDELWTIDELLGVYDSTRRKITIFDKGIGFIAARLGVPAEFIEYIVRIHEYGHAVFHLGVDRPTYDALNRAFLEDSPHWQLDTASVLTAVYASVDPYVHEQIAQLITWLALEQLHSQVSTDRAKTACAKLRDAFDKLMTRQPPAYRLDALNHLDAGERRKRLRAIVALIRAGDLHGTPHAWDTLIRW